MKEKAFNLMFGSEREYKSARILDLSIIAIIVINTAVVILDTFPNIHIHDKAFVNIFDICVTIIFTIEYAIRLWVSDLSYRDLPHYKARLKYAGTPMALIDLLAILPFYLPYVFPFDFKVIRLVRILRVVRILKITRYTSALETIVSVIKKKSGQLISSAVVILVLIIVTSVIMYGIEHNAQPEVFKNALSGMWWAVSTLITIGYGDIFPITALGKFLSTFIAFLGVALFAVPTGIISAGFIETPETKKKKSVIGTRKSQEGRISK